MAKYSVGVDFGTLSARALLIDMADGREIATAVREYPHGVMSDALPSGAPLPHGFALAHPDDYVDALFFTLGEVLRDSGVDPADVEGIGIDCTCSTLLAVDDSFEPLCHQPRFENDPYAYVIMWKHHGAERFAERLTDAAQARGEAFLKRYGGRVSSELTLPKLWEAQHNAPELCAAAYRFVEMGDYMVYKLTGRHVRSAPIAKYKAMWGEGNAPSRELLLQLDAGFGDFPDDRMGRDVAPLGELAGELTPEAAKRAGLRAGTRVGVAQADAFASIPAAGIARSGRLLMVMGTSTCDLVLGDAMRDVPGIFGMQWDGFMPGFVGFEAGQSCVGDMFNWFTARFVPPEYHIAAERAGQNLHQYLSELAAPQEVGAHGLVALDWFNGNRSILNDSRLSGLVLGMTLNTRPEDVFRALVESTAFGQRAILENFVQHVVAVDDVVACGGIAHKNPFMMQLYADVLGRDIHITRSRQTTALGAAMLGAVAAGSARGGFDSIAEAAASVGASERVYHPDEKRGARYDSLYGEYIALHDYFGRGGNDVMKRLM